MACSRKRLDAEAKLSNWTLTEAAFKNHSVQKYFNHDELKKEKNNDIKQGKNFKKSWNKVDHKKLS